MGLGDLSGVLWKERELLELLLFKLEEEQLVLASGRTRWLAHATREVELVLEQIRSAELLRSVELDAVAADLQLPAGVSLTALADAAPTPWDELFAAHRDAFLRLTAEITTMADANRDLLSTGERALRETLLGLDGTQVATYSATGRVGSPTTSAMRSRMVDQAL